MDSEGAQGQPCTAASATAPPILPQKSQPGNLEKSRRDKVIRACWNSSRREPTRLLEKCQPSLRCQSPLSAFLGNTLWLPSLLLIPTSVPEAWAPLGFTHWKRSNEWDGAHRGRQAFPSFPASKLQLPHPEKRCQLREFPAPAPSINLYGHLQIP